MLVQNSDLECNQQVRSPYLQVEAGKRYRLRVLNAGSLAGFTLSLPGSKTTHIQIDGGNEIQASTEFTAVGVLYPGERVDLITERESSRKGNVPQLVVILDQEYETPTRAKSNEKED